MHEPDQHASPITNWKQLVLVVALAFIVPIVLIVIVTQWVTGVSVAPSEKESAVLSRIQPVGEVVMASAIASTPAMAPAAMAAMPAVAAAGPAGGKKTYEAACLVCHGAGVAGAPKLGDKVAWAPRIKTGIDNLYQAALKGKGAMPAKGGNPALTDADVKAAVDLMVAASK